jgi:MFS superfamily sulfate permease-like transporter
MLRTPGPTSCKIRQAPPYVTILRIHGPFLFGATEKLLEETADLNKYAGIVILRLRHMTAIDATGLHGLEVLSARLKKRCCCAGRVTSPPKCSGAPTSSSTSASTTSCRMPTPLWNGRAKSRPALPAEAKNSPTI